jgi:hypothetical protein
MTVVRELARYKLDLVGVQLVGWDKQSTARVGVVLCLRGKKNNTQLH